MKEVKDFYRDIPFNYTDNISFYTNSIKGVNQVLEYEDLHNLIVRRKRLFGTPIINSVIEFGCGTGWLTNSLAYIYRKNVSSVDFTEKAIRTATLVSQELNVNPTYFHSDIFEYKDSNTYDLVISMGVLHHTKNCRLAFEKISTYVKPGGYLYVGLYHFYGRKPMLEFLQGYARWHGITASYNLFKHMSRRLNNPDHSFSWYRDQVLHPHETQHTLSEVKTWLNSIGFNLKSTSINNYASLNNISDEQLNNIEVNMEESSYKRNVIDLIFNPGYFTICAQKPYQV